MRNFVATAVTIALVAPAPAFAQDIQSMVGGPYTVPGGQTTTIDLGIPVSAGYSGGGWDVSTQGSVVTVTAPASGSISVPVAAQGYSATVTLIAEEGAAAPEVPEDLAPLLSEVAPGPEANGSEAPGSDVPGAPVSGDTATGGTAADPERADAEQIHLACTIEGNQIVAKLSLSQAMNLYNKFGNTSTEGIKLRYLTVNGDEIKGVKRKIDKGSRTLTLTYPEGQTPDNPFIMEAVKDGKSIAVVTLTDPNVSAAQPIDPAKSPSQPSTVSVDSSPTKKYGLYAVGGVLVLLLLVGLVTSLMRKRF